jgi:hypothetical protein
VLAVIDEHLGDDVAVALQPYLVATPFVSEPVSVAATDGSASAAALLLACDG